MTGPRWMPLELFLLFWNPKLQVSAEERKEQDGMDGQGKQVRQVRQGSF